MKSETAGRGGSTAFERYYLTALRTHATKADGSCAEAGGRVGRRALRLGVTTLDLARIHDRAAAALTPADERTSVSIAREESFFVAAVAPIEEAQGGRSAACAECKRLALLLEHRTSERDAARARRALDAEKCKALRAELRTRKREQRELLLASRLMAEHLRRLSHRILSSQEEERKRISRELHDAIGATLTGINAGLATLKREATVSARSFEDAIEQTQKLVEHSMRAVHRFAWELRPTTLEDLGLVPALRSLVRALSDRTGLQVRFRADAALRRLDDDRETAIYRITEGALRNVECHADAGRVRMTLRSLPGKVRLEVSDDGRSFDVRRMERSRAAKHMGLIVMRERAEMVGGSLSIKSSPEHGTTVRADFPTGEVAP